jgi:raffinose/stachyose/melibiose transport system substrate-binding protein
VNNQLPITTGDGDDVKSRQGISQYINGARIGLVVLSLAFIVSLFISIRNTLRIERPAKPVIFIAHWQLEKGYREALQHVINEYNTLHPDTIIKQMGVTERVYAQWLNTQLISGTAPDLCEMGMASLITQDQYTVRYFLPLSSYITQPNHYNVGTDLENVPWKETLLDGMRGGFREGLQEYFGIPTTLTSMRIYYNKDLLKAATGSDVPPTSFGDWMRQCEKIRTYGKEKGQPILPIVAAYKMDTVQPRFDPAFTSEMADTLDLDLNGDTSVSEAYVGYLTGKVSMDASPIRAVHETIRTMGTQMQKGFSAMDRQEAQYRFSNQLAGFLWSGSWDAGGVADQARRSGFTLGVFELPLPAPGEPNGAFVRGRANEGVYGAGNYAVFKGSKNADRALDFLKFLTCRRINQQLNQESAWPPLTLGAVPSDLMKPFAANPQGFSSKVAPLVGSRVASDVNSTLTNFYQGDAPYSAVVEKYKVSMEDKYSGAVWGLWFEFDAIRRDARNKERLIAQQQLLNLISPGSVDIKRYQRALLQQVSQNNGLYLKYLFKTYTGQALPEF